MLYLNFSAYKKGGFFILKIVENSQFNTFLKCIKRLFSLDLYNYTNLFTHIKNLKCGQNKLVHS